MSGTNEWKQLRCAVLQGEERKMAECNWCKKDMLDDTVISCVGNLTVEFPDSTALPAVRHDREERCPDCNIPRGGTHHPNCDQERCPKCAGQLISCGCLGEDATPKGNDFGYSCPSCHGTEDLEVQVSVWRHLVVEGTDDSDCNNDQDWDGDSLALCAACGWSGTVRDFEEKDENL